MGLVGRPGLRVIEFPSKMQCVSIPLRDADRPKASGSGRDGLVWDSVISPRCQQTTLKYPTTHLQNKLKTWRYIKFSRQEPGSWASSVSACQVRIRRLDRKDCSVVIKWKAINISTGSGRAKDHLGFQSETLEKRGQ